LFVFGLMLRIPNIVAAHDENTYHLSGPTSWMKIPQTATRSDEAQGSEQALGGHRFPLQPG
jgi:hypothetical protein